MGARFLVRRLAERGNADVARVHPFIQQIDGFTLAGAVDAGDQDHHRKSAIQEQVILHIQERFAQPRHLERVRALGDGMSQLCRFEHADFP